MTNNLSLSSVCSSYLDDKFHGRTTATFDEIVNTALMSKGISLNLNVDSERYNALQAYDKHVGFKNIFVNTLNNLLLDKWSATTETWRIWVNNYGLNDFRESTLSSIGIIKQPDLVPPGGEYTDSPVIGEQAFAMLETYGNKLKITRQEIMSDDIFAILAYISAISNAYDRQIGDKVYNWLISDQPSFEDRELFHSSHKNTVTTSDSIETDLGKAIEVMNNHSQEITPTVFETTRMQAKYLLVPPTKAVEASRVVGEYNRGVIEQQRLQVVVESRLSKFSGWFLVCDNPFPSISLFTLRDAMVPQIFTTSTLQYDGLTVKHRMDYDVKPLDYRGLVRIS